MNLDNRNLKRAEELLWKRYARDPDNLATAAKLVDTLTALGDMSRAKDVVQEVVLRYPENLVWKRRLGFIFLAEGDPVAAAEVVPASERTRDFWLRLAEAYHALAQDALAEEALLFGHKDSPDQAEPWSTVASWRAAREDTEGEKEALERALQYAPDNIGLLSRYFYNRAQAGDSQAALWAAEILQKQAPLDRAHLEALYALHRSQGNDEAARAVLEQLVARADATVADTLALVSVVYQQQDFTRARALLQKLSSQEQAFSPEVQEAIHAQTLAVQAALLLEAANRAEEQAVLLAVQEMQSRTRPPSPEALRHMVYVCLRLADVFTALAAEKEPENPHDFLKHNDKKGHERALFWLSQAQSVFDQHRDILPLSELANARLAADLAERGADWQTMLAAWSRVAVLDEQDVQAWLGMARAARQLNDPETSWQNLSKAEALAGDDADTRLALALQFQATSAVLPATDPQRKERQRHADAWARRQLDMDWNDELAIMMFYRAITTRDLSEAEKLLHVLGTRGRATAHDYLGLAEASLAAAGRTPEQGGTRGNAKTVPQGADRERVARNALCALSTAVPGMWPRLLYVFTAIDDKPQVLSLLQRIEHATQPETAESLHQRADAYGFLGDHARQGALMEQRARLTGLLAHWGDAIDRRYWVGDVDGALRLLDEAEKAHPTASELLARRLVVLVDGQRYGQAVKAFQNAQSRDPAVSDHLPAESLAALAVAYDQTHFAGRARHFFIRSLEKDPANQRASMGMASLARREGKSAQAVRYLQAYIAHDPTSLWAHLELASLRPDMGAHHYTPVLAQTQPDAQGKVAQDNKAARALALWRTGRLQEALSVYAAIMQEETKNPHVMCDYAQLLMDVHRYAEARTILAQTVQRFPDHVWAYRLDATILVREKDYARAEYRLQQALSRSPRNAEIVRDLAFVQQKQNKLWAAQKHWLDAGKR